MPSRADVPRGRRTESPVSHSARLNNHKEISMNTRRKFLSGLTKIVFGIPLVPSIISLASKFPVCGNRFEHLIKYRINLDAQLYPEWGAWKKLVNTIEWEPNMGQTMRGVRASSDKPNPTQLPYRSKIMEV